MKRNTAMALTLIVVTLSVVAISIVDFQNAAAAKASGISTPKYGSDTKHKVCGDQLCTTASNQKSIKVPNSEFYSLLDRMDAMHENHQNQMMEKWKSLSFEKQTQMLSQMNEKLTKMESMDPSEHISKMERMMQNHESNHKIKSNSEPLYNEDLNPRQIEYPNILGFNDLHIHAIRHLDVTKSEDSADHLFQTIVHHHCKVYDDMTAACLLFPYGMTDQDKPYGIEYVITSDQYKELPEDEKKYWHYHKTEFPRAQATFPELTSDELAKFQPILDETYGKVVYFWNYGDTYPIGEPYTLIVQDIPDQ